MESGRHATDTALTPSLSSQAEVVHGALGDASKNSATQVTSAVEQSSPMMPQRTYEISVELKAVMLSPEGLSVKRISSEGMEFPTTLRLQKLRSNSFSLTWSDDHNSLGKIDMRRLRAVRCGKAHQRPTRADTAPESDSNLGERDEGTISSPSGATDPIRTGPVDPSLVVLEWKSDDDSETQAKNPKVGELVLKASSEAERDSLAASIKLIASELQGHRKKSGVEPESRRDPSIAIEPEGITSTDDAPDEISFTRAVTDGEPGICENRTPCDVDPSSLSDDDADGDAYDLAPLPQITGVHPSHGLGRHWSDGDLLSSQASASQGGSSPEVRLVQGTGGRLRKGMQRRASSPYEAGRGRKVPEDLVSTPATTLEETLHRLARLHERGLAESKAASCLVSLLKLENLLSAAAVRDTKQCWLRWCAAVRRFNRQRMLSDRRQWCLHAMANARYDLQAWYHSTFHREVYRLRGPFWYKGTKLQKYYQKAYRISDGDPLTVMEKNVMKSCRWSSGTRYPDIMVHVYTAQGVLSRDEYHLFQKLIARDVSVPKAAPGRGRKHSRTRPLRVSFVRGGLYLTWKCKPDGSGHAFDGVSFAKIVYVNRLSTPPIHAAKAGQGDPLSVSGSGYHHHRYSERGDDGDNGDPSPSALSKSLSLAIGRRFSDRGAPELLRKRNNLSPHEKNVELQEITPRSCRSPPDEKVPPSPTDDKQGHGSTSEDGEQEQGVGGGSGAAAAPAAGTGGVPVVKGIAGLTARRRSSMVDDEFRERAWSSDEIRSQGEESSGRGSNGGGGSMAAAAAAAAASLSQEAGSQRGGHKEGERGCLLSVHFYSIPRTLDLWFSTETEGKTWQSMLMKLAMKEQGRGYSYTSKLNGSTSRSPPSTIDRDGRDAHVEHDEHERERPASPTSVTSSHSDRDSHGHGQGHGHDFVGALDEPNSGKGRSQGSPSPSATTCSPTASTQSSSGASRGGGGTFERWWPYVSPTTPRMSALRESMRRAWGGSGSRAEAEGHGGGVAVEEREGTPSGSRRRGEGTPDHSRGSIEQEHHEAEDDCYWHNRDDIASDTGSTACWSVTGRHTQDSGTGRMKGTGARPSPSNSSGGSTGGWRENDYRLRDLMKHVSLGGLCPAR